MNQEYAADSQSVESLIPGNVIPASVIQGVDPDNVGQDSVVTESIVQEGVVQEDVVQDCVVQECVVEDEARATWTDMLVASLTTSDAHVSDDEIFEILAAGGNVPSTADLCAVRNVTVPMYCVWKSKYRGLSLDHLREVRRREIWRARCLVGVLLIVVAAGAGGVVFGIVRAAQAITVSGPNKAVDWTATTINTQLLESKTVGAIVPATLSVSASPVGTSAVVAAPTPLTSTGEPRYDVQVAAADTVEHGRALVERLVAAGHPSYVSTAIVSNVEVFRVRVGPFKTLDEAKEVSRQLQRSGYAGAWIVR
jgi:cell division septation protein DedD